MANGIDADTLLNRKRLSDALTSLGLKTAPATLATMATRGGGPPFQVWGRTPLYRWGDALTWAHSRLSAPRRSTSEADATGAVTPAPRPVPAPDVGDQASAAAVMTLHPGQGRAPGKQGRGCRVAVQLPPTAAVRAGML
jgi:hypothetical protein